MNWKPSPKIRRLIDKHRIEQPIVRSNSPTPTLATASLFENRIAVSKTELAAQMGISMSTVNRMIKRGEIAPHYSGRRVLITEQSVEAWLSRKER